MLAKAVSPFRLLERGIDVKPLMEQLSAMKHLWDAHPWRTEFDTFKGTHDIWLRANDYRPFKERGSFAGFADLHIPAWYEAWDMLPTFHQVVFQMAANASAEMIGGILITKVPPGGEIKEHVDRGWHVDYFEKFYLTLQNAPGGVFGARVEDVVHENCPAPGDLVLFDNHLPHYVKNQTDIDRITLIVCLRTNLGREREIGIA